MANVPTLSVPRNTLQPSPTPLQQLTPPPLAFGAAAASEELGNAAKTAEGQNADLDKLATQIQAVNNKQAADSSYVGLSTALDQATGDYKSNNMGMAAWDNLGDAYKKLETIRGNFGQNLSPEAAVEYEANSRRAIAYAQSNIRDFAVSQRKTAITSTQEAKVQVEIDHAATDPTYAPTAAAVIGQTYAEQTKPEVLGLPPEVALDKTRLAVGRIYQSQIKIQLDGGDYPAAKALFDEHKGDMNDQQIDAVAGSLKVGQTAYIANAVRMSAQDGTPVRDVRTATPTGPWDSALPQFRADPASTISTLVGGPVTVTSGARSADHNAAVGGSPTSEHLVGNAWDFVPQKGTSTAAALQLASAMHASGMPFDQIEVEGSGSNAHVHVGFGEKNRNEVITAGGTVLAQGGGKGELMPPSLRASMTTDPNAFEAGKEAEIQKWVDANYKDNPPLGTAVQNSLLAGMRQTANLLRATQGSAYDRLASAAQSDKYQDTASLATAYPGASQDLALIQATPHYATGLKSITKANANELTPERQLNIIQLNGLADQSPDKFANENLAQYDLPSSIYLALSKKQQAIKASAAKGAAVETETGKALNSLEGQQALTGLGIPLKKDTNTGTYTKEYYQFAGALQEALDRASQGGKPVPQRELAGIIAQTAARVGGQAPSKFLGFDIGGTKGKPAYAVPDAEHDAIIAQYEKHGIKPSEEQIAFTYHRRLNSNAP